MRAKVRLEPAELLDAAAFEPLATLSGAERIAFLRHYFSKRPTIITRFHWAVTILLLITTLARAVAMPLKGSLLAVPAGMAIALIVIAPIHELIHAAAYWKFGARDIRWCLSLRRQIAYVTAHRFVLGRTELIWVAALPSIVISGLLGIAIVYLPTFRSVLLDILLFHHLGSRGDWAYLNYLWICRHRAVYAFDDAELGRSYFYVAAPGRQAAVR